MDITPVGEQNIIVKSGACSISIIISSFCVKVLCRAMKFANGEIYNSFSELYFLIGKFLLNTPFRDVAQVRNGGATRQLQ